LGPANDKCFVTRYRTKQTDRSWVGHHEGFEVDMDFAHALGRGNKCILLLYHCRHVGDEFTTV
jgi:hypothetical protein